MLSWKSTNKGSNKTKIVSFTFWLYGIQWLLLIILLNSIRDDKFSRVMSIESDEQPLVAALFLFWRKLRHVIHIRFTIDAKVVFVRLCFLQVTELSIYLLRFFCSLVWIARLFFSSFMHLAANCQSIIWKFYMGNSSFAWICAHNFFSVHKFIFLSFWICLLNIRNELHSKIMIRISDFFYSRNLIIFSWHFFYHHLTINYLYFGFRKLHLCRVHVLFPHIGLIICKCIWRHQKSQHVAFCRTESQISIAHCYKKCHRTLNVQDWKPMTYRPKLPSSVFKNQRIEKIKFSGYVSPNGEARGCPWKA